MSDDRYTKATERLEGILGALPSGSAEIREIEERCQVPTYRKLPIAAVRGEGARVYDAEGREYLDFYGGHAVALTGHGHPDVVGAVQAQAERLVFYSNLVYSDIRAKAVEALAAFAPEGLGRVFLCNSGAEANETALKLARKHTGRSVILSMNEGFHGRTLGVLGATGIETYRDAAYPIPTEHRYVPYGDVKALDKALTHDVAGVILEPIPSMGGIREAAPAYFQALRGLCTDRGAFLVFDEVQTGFGRTGTPFYGAHVDVVPDLITGAKGIASGFPAGAVFVRDRVADNIAFGEQGTTFGGGPLACAAIAANLAVIQRENLMAHATEMERAFKGHCLRVAGVEDVVGRGLLLGIDLDRPSKPVVQRLISEFQILSGSAGGKPNQIRILAPLVIQEPDVARFAQALGEILA